jgi:CRISPR/Cas system endoribonuclease Cas6 (RAMP superfamily)
MSTKENKGNLISVSPIVKAWDKDGNNLLGFTVYHDENNFYNVLRSYSDDDYDEVYHSLERKRKQLLRNKKN